MNKTFIGAFIFLLHISCNSKNDSRATACKCEVVLDPDFKESIEMFDTPAMKKSTRESLFKLVS